MKNKRPGASTGHGTGVLMPRGLHEVLEAERAAKRAKIAARRERAALKAAGQLGRETGREMRRKAVPEQVIVAGARLAARYALNVIGRDNDAEA